MRKVGGPRPCWVGSGLALVWRRLGKRWCRAGVRGSNRGDRGRFGAGVDRRFHLVLRLVTGLDHILEGISDLVIQPDVGKVGQFDLFASAPGRGRGQSGGVIELSDAGKERPGLVELHGIAVAVEEALEERLLVAHEVGDPRLDSLLANEIVDVDGLRLPQPVNPADPLLEDGRVPG